MGEFEFDDYLNRHFRVTRFNFPVLEKYTVVQDGNGEEILVIELARLCFREETDTNNFDNILETIFRKQGDAEFKQVAFVLRNLSDIKMMINVAQHFNKQVALGNLKNIVKEDSHKVSNWPSDWVTYVYLDLEVTSREINWPFQLWGLPNLERLFISGGRYVKVPRVIGRLRNLKQVGLRFSLTQLPNTMRFCSNIEYLDISGNALKSIPMWVSKLPKLVTLSRHDNILDVASVTSPLLKLENQPDERSRINKNGPFSPPTLFVLAAAVTLSTYPCLGTPTFETDILPKSVLSELLFHASDLNFCDCCEKPFFKDQYLTAYKTVIDFKGYKHVPFKAILCGEICASKLMAKWSVLAVKEEKNKKETFCFDVPPSDDVMNLHQSRMLHPNNHGCFSGLFCCS